MTLNHLQLALQACPCERAYGTAFACPATLLPRIADKMVIRGPVETIPYPMPLEFICPRHEIMGW